ncbi:MAG: hypothetical protein DRI32_06125 [Chloroflexi bacterium]|nr:MAG: hypothetical protein DRI32_06125 [Chloroflexota bacterium]
MTRSVKFTLPLLIVFSLSCGLFAPVSPAPPRLAPLMETGTAEVQFATQTEIARVTNFTATPNLLATEVESEAMIATLVAAYTPTPTSSATPEIDPADLMEEEKPIPPPAISPGGSYRLENEVLIGAYGIRYWHNVDIGTDFEDIVLIEKTGVKSIKIETASAIAPLTGADINGDGYPEVIIETYSGGAHCCIGTQVYSLGETPTLILKKPESNAGGQFQDLNGDRVYEFITHDDIFAYEYCPYVSSPFVKVIMAYDAEKGSYLPASPAFPDEYIDDIAEDLIGAERVAKAGVSESGEWDETSKCSVLPLVLDYVFIGDLEKARSELDRVYTFDDLDRFWNDILFILQDSPLYVEKEVDE